MQVLRHKSGNTRSWRSRLWLSLKLVASAGLVAYLYYLLAVANDLPTLYQSLRAEASPRWPWWGLLIVGLVPINLGLEAWKFGLLLQPNREERPSFNSLIRRVCAGIAVGIWTPNRVGEYAGRLVGVAEGGVGNTLASTLLGGIAQWVPLLLGGVLAVAYLGLGPELLTPLTLSLAVLLIFLVLALYFNVSVLISSLAAWATNARTTTWSKAKARIHRFLVPLAQGALARRSLLFRVLGLSVLRYIVYVIQIALAYLLVGLSAPWIVIVCGVAVLLLLQSVIPLPSGLQVLARAELSLLVWAAFAPSPLAVTAASLLILVLNLGVPAFVGLIVILQSDEGSLTT